MDKKIRIVHIFGKNNSVYSFVVLVEKQLCGFKWMKFRCSKIDLKILKYFYCLNSILFQLLYDWVIIYVDLVLQKCNLFKQTFSNSVACTLTIMHRKKENSEGVTRVIVKSLRKALLHRVPKIYRYKKGTSVRTVWGTVHFSTSKRWYQEDWEYTRTLIQLRGE